jgi:archaellum component FlaC
MKKLEKIIKEAILEVLAEQTIVDKTTKVTDVKGEDPKTVLAAIEAAKKSNKPVSIAENDLDEMARIPIQYKIADLDKLDDLSDKVKNSKSVQGIISYLQDKSQAPVAQIAKDQFDRPQQAINPVIVALTNAGVLDTVGGSGVAASRVSKSGEVAPPTTKQTLEPEDFFIGKGKFDGPAFEPSEEEIAASFAKARSIDGGEADFIASLPKDAPKVTPKISDEDYDKLMKYLDLKDRLKNIESNIRQNRKLAKGGSDLAIADKGEEERLKNKVEDIKQRINSLINSSEYLKSRKSSESEVNEIKERRLKKIN